MKTRIGLLGVVLIACTSLNAAADDNKDVEILTGTILEFQRDIPLTENRTAKDRQVSTKFQSELTGNVRCHLSTQVPAYSRATIPARSRFRANWKGSRLQLVNVNTGKVDATLYCYTTANFNFDIYPESKWSNKMYESLLTDLLAVRVVGDVMKHVSIGSADARAPSVSRRTGAKVVSSSATSSTVDGGTQASKAR